MLPPALAPLLLVLVLAGLWLVCARVMYMQVMSLVGSMMVMSMRISLRE